MSNFVDYYIAEFDYFRWVLYGTIVLSDMCCFPLFLNSFSYSVFGGTDKVLQAHSRVSRG